MCVCASATPLEHTEQVSGTCLLVDMTCYEYLEGVLLELTKTKQIEKNEAFSRKTIEYHRHIIPATRRELETPSLPIKR